jgi:hypothetical protein
MDVTVSYQFTRDDCQALVRANLSQTKWGRIMLWTPALLWAVLFVTGALILLDLSLLEDASFSNLLIIIEQYWMPILMAGLLTFPVYRILVRFSFPNLSIANKTVTFHFEDDGFQMKVGGIEVRYTWPSVYRLIETNENLFIFIGRSEGQIVPRRAMASDQKFAELAAAIRSKVDAISSRGGSR